MKKTCLLLALSLGVVQLFSQTLFTYGGTAVSKDEFLRAYNKNKIPVEDNEKALREYLDLYSKFKLKVKAAKELRLDTLQQLKLDMQNFSSQVEEGYIHDETKTAALLDEAIDRGRKDIHIIHFFTPLTTATNAVDSLKAIKGMDDMALVLHAGDTNYIEMAAKIIKDNVPVTVKDLGFITVFSLPYNMENLVYNIKPGDITKVYRSKTGLHLFKNVAERKSAGRWKIAQILFALPPDANEEKIKEIAGRADSVYALLKAGADFKVMARQFSDDKLTTFNGGEIPEFGTGKYENNFEKKVFELQKDGDILKPFSTIFGYHIIKRIQYQPIPDNKKDEVFTNGLKLQIEKDSRIKGAKEAFLKDVLLKIAFKRTVVIKEGDIFNFADSVFAHNSVGRYAINDKVLFSFTKKSFKGIDWLNFVKDYKLNPDVYKGETNKELFNKFISTSAFEYYRKHLSEYNVDFKYQMEEFREGNMLFEIMEKNIWGKASGDSLGLKNYFNLHASKYKWNSSAAILLFTCSDSATANQAIKAIKNNNDWKQLMDKSNGKIQADSGRYELSQLQIPVKTILKEGIVTTPILNEGDNTTTFIKILQLFPAMQQRTFNEARGLIINDYQKYLEDKWVEALQKNYPVKVNDAVFKTLL